MELLNLPIHQSSLPTVLEHIAGRFLQFRLSQPPPIDQTGLKVVSWNVTALSPLEDCYKNRLLKALSQNHVICLQETKMTLEDANLLELQMPGCRVLSTAAVAAQETDEGSPAGPVEQHSVGSPMPASGGVLVMLPTYLCTTNCVLYTLVPGYAVAVAIAHKSFQWCVVSCYLRSGHEQELLDKLHKELRKLAATQRIETFILAGDFNSNTIWDKKRRESNHSNVVKRLEEKGIFSAYHLYFQQIQGQEAHPTLYLYRHQNRPYHLDYCFVSADLAPKIQSVNIGEYDFWMRYSDHVPVIVRFNS
jgi:exonuclease III